jgi:DNA topoisomerase-1
VVVESPTKVKTIQKYLDSKYVVKASMGHVRDLPKSKLGVDEKKGFKPEYKVLPAKKKVLDDLKKAAEKVEALYIASAATMERRTPELWVPVRRARYPSSVGVRVTRR